MKPPIKLLSAIAAIFWAAPIYSAPILQYSQDGKNFTNFSVITGEERASTYYDYRNKSGHPDFGLARGTVSVATYWDETRNVLSLVVIGGSEGSRRRKDKGRFTLEFDNLPYSTYLALSDDPKEYMYDKGQKKSQATFSYKNSTDGLIFSGLQKPKKINFQIALEPLKGIKDFRLVDGDVNDAGQFLDLDMDAPLYIRTAQAASTPPGRHHHHHTLPAETPPVIPPASGGVGNDPPTRPGAGPSVPEPGISLCLLPITALFLRRRHG